MLFLGNGLRSAAVVAAVALAAPVLADAPVMVLTVSAGSAGKTLNLAPNSTSSSGVGSYFGAVSGTNGTSAIWNCNYNFSAASGADFATQSGAISLTNTSGQDLAFAMTLALPVAAMGPMTGQFNGSVAAALITNSASGGVGTMSQSGGFPLWVAKSGGVQVASLFNSWSSVSRTTPGASLIGSASFGGSTPSVPAESFGDPLSVTFYFVLSNNATASFTTAFGGVGIPVPAPGAFALLATAGLVARRRRR
jgi:hypothetical protein